MKVRELIAQLQDDIDPEANVYVGAFQDPIVGLEAGRRRAVDTRLSREAEAYVTLVTG